jgi:glycosyltransferase involved in cell wall biosynthesis
MDCKRLALFTASYPYGNGETFIESEIPHLLSVFDQVTIFPFVTIGTARSLPPCVETSPDLGKKAWRIMNLSSWIFLFALFAKNGFSEYERGKKLCGSMTSLRVLLSALLAAGKAHAVLSRWLATQTGSRYFYSYWNGPALLAARALGHSFKNVVTRAHRVDLYEEESAFRFLPFFSQALDSSDAIYCISKHGVKYLNSRLPGISKIVHFSPLGVTAASVLDHPIKPHHIRLLSCSTLEPQKRPIFLADCIKSISNAYPNSQIQWTHFGDGSLATSFYAKIGELPASVVFQKMGSQPNAEVRKFMSNEPIDFFLNVSSSEGLPVSIMEAMASGIPVIATNVGGTAEIVNSQNGCLLPPTPTFEEVVEAVRQVMSTQPEWDSKRKNAYQTWETQFNAESNFNAFAQQLIQL